MFLTIALKILWINRKNKRLMRGKANVHRNTVKYILRLTFVNKFLAAYYVYLRDLLKGSIILLPLLGITWIIGILAVNEETQVFAWIFAIFNSLQVCYTSQATCICSSNVYVCTYIHYTKLRHIHVCVYLFICNCKFKYI